MNHRCLGVACLALLGLASLATADDARKALLVPGTTLVEPQIPESVQGRIRRLNVELSQNLKPADNAGVYLVQLFGANVFEPVLREASLAMLGIGSLSLDGPRLISPEEYVLSLNSGDRDLDRARAAKIHFLLQRGIEQTWSANDWPDVAAFLDANAGVLDAVRKLASLKRYYVPLLSEETPPRITGAALGVELRMTWLGRLLTVQATRQAPDGDSQGSIADLMACHRMAALLADGSPTDISHSKAHLIDAIACEGGFQLLKSGRLSPAAARDYLKQFDAAPRLLPAATAADRGERAILAQELEILEHDESSVRDYLEIAKEKRLANLEETRLADVKWDLAQKRAMELQDRVVAALKTQDHHRQEEQFGELDRIYDAWSKKSEELSHPDAGVVEMDLDEMSRWIGETLAMSLRSNYRPRRATDDRAEVRRGMLRIGLALVAYAGDQGKYPDKLDALQPRYLEKVPLEAFSEAPFHYERRTDRTADLTSWGQNQADDAGKFYNDDKTLALPAPKGR